MGKVINAVAGAVLTVVGFVTANPLLIAQGMAMTISALVMRDPSKNNQNAAHTSRLNKQLLPEDFRKIIFGRTAGAADMRYWEVGGTDGNRYTEVIAVATHPINSFGDFYIQDKLAYGADGHLYEPYGNITNFYKRTVGVSGSGLTLGYAGLWDARMSMTGCAYYAIDWTRDDKRTPSGIPSRYTMVVEGAPLYDPRRDISLGGTHDISDQTTWQYAPTDSNGVPIGRNNALQMLWYLIGWRINGAVVAGRAVDPVDINLNDFIVAANVCEAYQWYSDMILSTGDSHSTNEAIIAAAAGGKLLDTGGRFSYHVASDDTASVAQVFTDADIVGNVEWVPRLAMDQQFNAVVGTFTDPGTTSLYQPRTYGIVDNAAYYAADGFKRRKTLNFQAVQDQAQAQKLARIVLNTSREQGTFRATFSYKAMRTKNWDVVKLTFSRYGWVNKLFRIQQQSISPMGGIDLTLVEEDPAFYGGGTIVTTSPGVGVGKDQTHQIPVTGFGSVDISIASADGKLTMDGVRAYWTRPSSMVARTDVMYQAMYPGGSAWVPAGSVNQQAIDADGTGVDKFDIYPLPTETAFNVRARHVSVYGVPGPWSTSIATTGSTTSMDASLVKIANQTVTQAFADANQGIATLKDFQNKLAELDISNTVRVQHIRDYLEALGYTGGIPLGTVIAQNKTQQVNGDNLIAQIINLIGAATPDLGSFILNTLTTKVSPTQTLADAFTQQTSYTNTLRADWQSEVTTQASTNSTYASYFTYLGAAGTGINAGSWILNTSTVKTTYDGQTLGTTLAGMQSNIGSNNAAIASEATTRASGDSANATSISTVSTTVSGHTASITGINSSINGINARASVSLDVSGNVTGYYIAATATSSSFNILTSNFAIVDPGGVGGAFTPFSYSSGLFKMTNIEVDTVKANTITTNHLIGAAVTAATLTACGGGVSFSFSQTTYISAVQSNVSGGPMDVTCQFQVTNPNAADRGVDITVYRNGTQIDQARYAIRQGFTQNIMLMTFDSPGAGFVTYDIKLNCETAGVTMNLNGGICRVIEYKR